MEEYEEKELEEKFEEQEVYVSFKAESLSKRTLCLRPLPQLRGLSHQILRT